MIAGSLGMELNERRRDQLTLSDLLDSVEPCHWLERRVDVVVQEDLMSQLRSLFRCSRSLGSDRLGKSYSCWKYISLMTFCILIF